MENRIKWLESIIRERCSNIDLNNGMEQPLEALDELPTGNSTQHSVPQTRSSARATAHDLTQEVSHGDRPHEQPALQLPITQEEPQQAHEIGLVSLFRGEDPRYIGPSSGYSFAKRIFSNPGRHGRPESAMRADGIASRFPAELLNPPASLPAQKEVAVELSIKYFETIHLLYPFLHQQTHMEMLGNVYGRQEEDPISSFQVYMVLAIASLNLSRKCKLQLPAEGYYASAMKNADYVCQHGSMAALQCLLLLMFPLDISDADLISATPGESAVNRTPSHMSLSIRLFRLAQLNSEIKYIMHSINRDVPHYAYPPVKDIFAWQRDMMKTLEDWYFEVPQQTRNWTTQYCNIKYHEIMILLLRPSPAIPSPADDIFELCSEHAYTLLACFGNLYESGNLLYSRFVVHSIFLGTLVVLHCIWKFPRTATKFSVDELIIKFNISQNILSSIGEHWAEALGARDCIAELSTITVQRLLKNQSSAASTSLPSQPSMTMMCLQHRSAREPAYRHLEQFPATPRSSNAQGQTFSEANINHPAEPWPTTSEYPNLFDDLLRTDLEGWNGTSDIDGLISEVLNIPHF
ncbi:hypothetical protein UA08_08561 [Talaromyces atroroseus]|uniref:Transcription factor domain-containing protein n=1 Tax=Talaromyces atroroseus TaxID=1441469 RepID=A0A1Q5Q7H4_TALAT|nr:hypothetical protein UA08_08561 [Talaromyces atroroseus]OKL56179.1 hypothetical protein UA08_08561 [Talaromyces atroroseus]